MFCRLFLFVTTAVVLTACSSGQTAFRRGHFDLAVKKASNRLDQRPGLTKRGYILAPLVLKQAFERAYEQHQTAIRRLSVPTNTDAFRWEVVYKEYTALQTLTDNARRCTGCTEWLAAYPASYADRQRDTRELAAADRYEAAEQAFPYREENRLAAKDAYLNYRKALEWVPDYRQAHGKSEDALPFAILRVVIEPLSPTNEISSGDNRELQGLIFRQIGRNPSPSKFVRLYPPDEMAGDGFPIHQAVQMQVTDYSPYGDNTSSSCTTVYSNQAYKVGEKKINDTTKVDIMEKVQGTLTTYQRTISAGITLRMRVIDTESGNELWHDVVSESRSWQTEWQTFSGDERALNGQSLATANAFPPSRWQLYDSMRDELADDVARRLQSKYSTD
ncbi:hypothetical protein [Spirosoma areae]